MNSKIRINISAKTQNVIASIMIILIFGAVIYINWNTSEYINNKSLVFYSFLILSITMLLHTSSTKINKNSFIYNIDIFLFYFIIGFIVIFIPFFVVHKNNEYIYYFSKLNLIKFSIVNEINIIIGVVILFRIIIAVVNKKNLNFIANFIILNVLSVGFQRYFYSSKNAVIILVIIGILYMLLGIWKFYKRKYSINVFLENLFINLVIIIVFTFSGDYIDSKIKYFSNYSVSKFNINLYFALGIVFITLILWVISYIFTCKNKNRKLSHLFCIFFSVLTLSEIMFFLQWNYILFFIFILFILVWSYMMFFIENLAPWEEYSGFGYILITVIMIIADFMLYIGWIDLFITIFDFLLIMIVAFTVTNDIRYRLCALCFSINILIADLMYHFSFDWYFVVLFLILNVVSIIVIFFLHSFFTKTLFWGIPVLFLLASIPIVLSGTEVNIDIAKLKLDNKIETLGENNLLNSLISIKAKPRNSEDIYSIELKWNDEEPKLYIGFNEVYTKLREGTLKVKVIDSKGVYSFKRINYRINGKWKEFDDVYPPQIDAPPNGIYNSEINIFAEDKNSNIAYIIYNIENESDSIFNFYDKKLMKINLPIKFPNDYGKYTVHAYAIDSSFNLSKVITRTYTISN